MFNSKCYNLPFSIGGIFIACMSFRMVTSSGNVNIDELLTSFSSSFDHTLPSIQDFLNAPMSKPNLTSDQKYKLISAVPNYERWIRHHHSGTKKHQFGISSQSSPRHIIINSIRGNQTVVTFDKVKQLVLENKDLKIERQRVYQGRKPKKNEKVFWLI